MSELNISDAILTRQFDLKGGGVVSMYVWKPYPCDEKAEDYVCPARIVGIGSEKIKTSHGVDALQALTLCLQTLGVTLYSSREYENEELTYLGSRDLDLPLIPGATPGYNVYGKGDLLTFAGYCAAIKMPDQKFPYVAFPGDALRRLISRLQRILRYIDTNSDASRNVLSETISGLIGQRNYYEAVCKTAGLHPSYLTIDQSSHEDDPLLLDDVEG